MERFINFMEWWTNKVHGDPITNEEFDKIAPKFGVTPIVTIKN